MTGGKEIHPIEGVETAYAASRAGYRRFQLLHRMNTDRQPNALYTSDGEVAGLEEFVLINGSGQTYLPFEFSHIPKSSSAKSFFGLNLPPDVHSQAVAFLGLAPAYEAQLEGFKPHNFQHLVRYTRNAKVLAWLGNDALSKDGLRLEAELFRLTHHPHFKNKTGNSPGKMLANAQLVASDPGKGIDFGRGEAWGTDAVVATFAMADLEWREQVRPWLDTLSGILELAPAGCHGGIQAKVFPSGKMLEVDGEKIRGRQAYEESYIQIALRGMVGCVYEGTGDSHEAGLIFSLERSYRSLTSSMAWSDGNGPWRWLAVGPLEISEDLFCTPGDENHDDKIDKNCWSSLGHAFQLTQDEDFFLKAIEMGGGSVESLLAELQNADDLPHQADLLALLQDHLGL